MLHENLDMRKLSACTTFAHNSSKTKWSDHFKTLFDLIDSSNLTAYDFFLFSNSKKWLDRKKFGY